MRGNQLFNRNAIWVTKDNTKIVVSCHQNSPEEHQFPSLETLKAKPPNESASLSQLNFTVVRFYQSNIQHGSTLSTSP